MSDTRRFSALLLTILTSLPVLADIAPGSLRVEREQDRVRLDWQAGAAPYAIHRGRVPQTVLDPSNLVHATTITSYGEPIPLDNPTYYKVVDPPVGTAACSLTASATTIDVGDSSTLNWSTLDAVSVTLNGAPIPHNGALAVSPVQDKNYVLEANGTGSSTTCQVDVTVTPTAGCTNGTPCIAWCGDGIIDDIVTGNTIEIDGPDMAHVLILAEGYTAADLATGVFDDDVDEWLTQWEVIEPYTSFKSAFCIWKQPLVSNANVAPTSPQTADTALLVPITSDGEGIASSVPLTGPTSQRVWSTVTAGFPYPPTTFYPSGGRTSKIAKNLVVVVLVYDVASGESGLSGRARRLENPSDSDQRISAAFAHNRPHEFTHAFSRVNDEYMEDCCGPLCSNVGPNPPSADLTNVVCDPGCTQVPWGHLLEGGAVNSSVADLVGAFGVSAVGFHPEFRCLMNGTHDNATYYGGDGRLRVFDRMCNFCREMTIFRLFERIGVLSDPATSWDDWATSYRTPYFDAYGFAVPVPVPQENNLGTPFFEDCLGAKVAAAPPAVRDGHEGCDIEDP